MRLSLSEVERGLVGGRLRDARVRLGVKRSTVAAFLDLDWAMVRAVEVGELGASLALLVRWVRLLRLEVGGLDRLLSGVGPALPALRGGVEERRAGRMLRAARRLSGE